MYKECLVCGEEFSKSSSCSVNNFIERTKYCSWECRNKSKLGTSPWNKGTNSWVAEHKGKTAETHKIELANIDHLYKRNLDNFISLCASCHRRYDYGLIKLTNSHRKYENQK